MPGCFGAKRNGTGSVSSGYGIWTICVDNKVDSFVYLVDMTGGPEMIPEVVGLGMSCVDDLALVPHLPRLDEGCPMLDYSRQGGGLVATAMVAVACLGGKAGYIGVIDGGERGNFIRAEFERYGVDISRLRIDPAAVSPFFFVLVDRDTGSRSIIFNSGRLPELVLNDDDLAYIGRARVLHLDGTHVAAAVRGAKFARDRGIKVTIDVSSVGPHTELLIRNVDAVVAAGSFPERFTGESDLAKAARMILDYGPSIVVVTLGERGALCVTPRDIFHEPGFVVPVVDTTGAGDVFHGTFALGLARGWELRKIVEWSNAAAALKCRKLGGRAGIPTYSEVESFLMSEPARSK